MPASRSCLRFGCRLLMRPLVFTIATVLIGQWLLSSLPLQQRGLRSDRSDPIPASKIATARSRQQPFRSTKGTVRQRSGRVKPFAIFLFAITSPGPARRDKPLSSRKAGQRN